MIFMSRQRLLAREHSLAQADAIYKTPEAPTLGIDCVPDEYASDCELAPGIFDRIVENSHEFFSHSTPRQFTRTGNKLSFESNLCTSIPENNVVHCNFFQASRRDLAAIILPYWNASGEKFDRIASLLALCGVSTLRLSLPYHDNRRPHAWPIARFMVSSNIGRTIQSVRQAVLDVRCAIDWLMSQGYAEVTVIGFSIGSCIATIAAAHDVRVRSIVQVLMASNFAEVVWTGIATEHIRRSLEGYIDLEMLKRVWAGISPDTYVDDLFSNATKVLMLTARFDPVFLPRLADEIEREYVNHSVDYDWRVINCGHYTLGEFPHNFKALVPVIRWLRGRTR